MDELKVVEGMKAPDGSVKATRISNEQLEGDLTSWPELERVTDFLSSQGWEVANQAEDGGKVTVTLKRPVKSENDELYRAIGYERPPVTASPEQIEHATRQARDWLRYSGG